MIHLVADEDLCTATPQAMILETPETGFTRGQYTGHARRSIECVTK